MIPRCALWLLFAAMQVQSVRFTYLRYFVSQLRDSFFDGILHDDRLAGHTELGSADLPYDTEGKWLE